jgi:hypothetical protein
MGIPERRGTAGKKHRDRAAWLKAHPECYVGVPGEDEDVTAEGRAQLETLRTQMVALGLFGVGSQQQHRDTIRRLVSDLRGVRKVVVW